MRSLTKVRPSWSLISIHSPLNCYSPGLHAVAYKEGQLVVLDSTSLRVLTKSEFDLGKINPSKKKSHDDPASSVRWLGSGEHDEGFEVQDFAQFASAELNVCLHSGHTWLLQFVRTDHEPPRWEVSTRLMAKTSIEHPTQTFFVEGSRSIGLAEQKERPLDPSREFWIVSSRKEARCFSSMDGDRISKTTWKSEVEHAEVIGRNGIGPLPPMLSATRLIPM